MKDCINCIHFSICAYTMHDGAGNLLPCDDFMDTSKFVYAPFLVDDISYVITKYSYSSPHEVVKCRVTKTNLKKGMYFLITCQGRYANGNWYRGSLSSTSLGKTLFKTREEAERRCNELNVKKN